MPFYRRLSDQRDRNGAHGLRIVAVSSEPPAAARSYLASHGVVVDLVLSARLPTGGTPTLVIVNRQSRVVTSWLGLAPPRIEQRIERLLFTRSDRL